jgi:hypothetical protein
MQEHWAPNPSPQQRYSACWRMRRALKGECRAHVVKGHMRNPWHRLRPLPAASLVVRRRCLSEVPGLLTAAPLVERRKVPWPLRRCALWVLNSGAQANARPAVRAHASPKQLARQNESSSSHSALPFCSASVAITCANARAVSTRLRGSLTILLLLAVQAHI